MENNKKQDKEFMRTVSKSFSEYERFRDNTLRKISQKTEFFEAIIQEIPTTRKTTPGLIEKYFKHSLFVCAEEVSIQGNYMKEAYHECTKYLDYYDDNQKKLLNEYEEIKDTANKFIDRVREYFYDYEQGKVPFPKITYTR